MKKYLILLIIPFMLMASCMEDTSAYLAQDKENVTVDNVTGGSEEEEEPKEGELTPGIHLVKLNVTMADGQVEEKRFKYFMPVSIVKDKPISMIFEFHGSYEIKEGVTPDPIESISISHTLNQLAVRENCIIVFPAGEDNGKSVDWSVGDYVKNLPFVDAMIDYFKKSTPLVDMNRVYSTGQSSGAIFSCVLAYYRSEIFAAVAPRAGRMNIENNIDPLPTRAVHFRMFLGEEDETVNHAGSLKDMILWAEKIGGYFPNSIVESEEPFQIEKYKLTDTRKFNGAKADIEIFTLKEEGHGVSLYYVCSYIWEFFKSHTLISHEDDVFVTSREVEILVDENEKYTLDFNYSDYADVTVNAPESWNPIIDIAAKTLQLTAPSDFMAADEYTGNILITAKKNGKTKTLTVPYNLKSPKTHYSIGDVYYNNNREAVGVVFWINPKNKREAKILNLEEIPGNYPTINYGNFGATFCTPDENDGKGNTAKSVQENIDKNLRLTNATSGLIWAATYSYKGVEGWYLPAVNELVAIQNGISKVNPVIKEIGGSAIEPAKALDGGYLSSTVKPSGVTKEFMMYNFFDKKITSQIKDNTSFFRARAIKTVTL